MLLERLDLTDVRSYDRASCTFAPGSTVLIGSNGHGKTNLLEAIFRAASGRSHRVASDGPLVRVDAEVGVIRCHLLTDERRRRSVELEVGTGRRTRTRVDGQDVRRTGEALGVLRAVLFAPEDLSIVRGDPAERRRFLDDVLAQRRPAFAAARAEYERALKQRNQLLKQARSLRGSARDAATSTIDVWTEQLVTHGTHLLAARVAVVRALQAPTDTGYRQLADRPERVGLRYRSTAGEQVGAHQADGGVPDTAPIAAAFRRSLDEARDDELDRGLTLVGPHRDDLELTIGQLAAKGYASQGEAWSLALALKLATSQVLAQVGDRPVILLDDVFSELDEARRHQLAVACGGFDQVIVTAAVEADVPLGGRRIEVVNDDGLSRLRPRDDAAGASTDGTVGAA